MTPILPAALAALALALPTAALARDHKARGPGDGAGRGGCPPGLAKKDPPCIPPGQARRYGVGDTYGEPIVVIEDDRLPPLRDGEAWVRVGDQLLRLDRESRVIFDVVTLLLD